MVVRMALTRSVTRQMRRDWASVKVNPSWSSRDIKGSVTKPGVKNYLCRQLLQHSGAIVAEDGQLHRVGGFSILLANGGRLGPLHGDAPVGFIHEIGHIRAAYRVDGHALAARHVTHNSFAANRIAAAG